MKYHISTIFIFILLSTLHTKGQENETWIHTMVQCDTCQNKNCDTLIIKKHYNCLNCVIAKDTVYYSKSSSESPPISSSILLFIDLDFFVCSKTLIDSNKNYKEYKIIEPQKKISYEQIHTRKKYKLIKTFNMNQELLSIDSIRINQKGKNKKSFFISYTKDTFQISKTYYQYYPNGKLKRIERFPKSTSKFVYLYTKNGDLNKQQYLVLNASDSKGNKPGWVLFYETLYNKINHEFTIENRTDCWGSEPPEETYVFRSKNYLKWVTKIGCTKQIKIKIKI